MTMIGEAVAVHIARRSNGTAAEVAGIDAVKTETVGTVQAPKIDRRCETGGLAEHHIAFSGIRVPARIAASGADDDVGEAIAVHIPGRGDGSAAFVVGIDAVEPEAGGAVEAGEIDGRGKARSLAEHHIARPLLDSGAPTSAPGAPMTMSAKPSPFTSPAESDGNAAVVVRH